VKSWLLLAGLTLLAAQAMWAQEFPDEADFGDPVTSLWLGSYLNARVTNKFFWAGELHVRTDQTDETPFVGRMGQIYNRHGVKYLFSKNFSATVGGVLRLNFTPQPGNPEFKPLVLEPRIWHEYLFAIPLERIMVYHRLRIEHRWSKSNREGAEFIYRDRWRYKFFMKIPLNRPKLVPGAFYFQPDVELIMQSGKPVVGSPMEDLRIYPIIGYIFNPRVGASAGVTYSLGQNLDLGYEYRQRWLLRFNCYISLDFRKFEERIPTSKLTD
jgi:hypothetical protein